MDPRCRARGSGRNGGCNRGKRKSAQEFLEQFRENGRLHYALTSVCLFCRCIGGTYYREAMAYLLEYFSWGCFCGWCVCLYAIYWMVPDASRGSSRLDTRQCHLSCRLSHVSSFYCRTPFCPFSRGAFSSLDLRMSRGFLVIHYLYNGNSWSGDWRCGRSAHCGISLCSF